MRARTLATLGARDARYIRNVVKAVRYSNLIGRELSTSSDLTRAEASRVIDALKQDAEVQS